PVRSGRRGSSARRATSQAATTDFHRKWGISRNNAVSLTRCRPGGSSERLTQVAAAETGTPAKRSLSDVPISTTHRAKNAPLRSSTACHVSVIFDSSPPTRRGVVPDHAGAAPAGSAVGAASRLPPNTVTYTVGRKISVSKVATRRPPIIAKAIGPQNTVG